MSRRTRNPKTPPAGGQAPAQQRRAMAEAGDVDGLWQLITGAQPGLLDVEATFKLLLKAIEVAAIRDPAAFAGQALSRLVGFTAYLSMRGQFFANGLLADRGGLGAGAPWFPRDVTEVVIPALIELQGHLSDLLHAQASTARLWGLALRGGVEGKQGKAPIALGDRRAIGHQAGDHRLTLVDPAEEADGQIVYDRGDAI